MAKGKKYIASLKLVEKRPYSLEDAVPLVQKIASAKFDETVELHMRLGVDPKHADQMVRGTVVLPHGLGQTKRVCVIAQGEKIREAQDAGAEIFGGNELVEEIRNGRIDFDALIATPDMMKEVGKLGKVLGPKGLMPNPKTGTVTTDLKTAIREIKAGRVEFRVDKFGIIHVPLGKKSFTTDKLLGNAQAMIGAILKAKPPAAKGKYVRSGFIAATMSPSVQLDMAAVEAGA